MNRRAMLVLLPGIVGLLAVPHIPRFKGKALTAPLTVPVIGVKDAPVVAFGYSNQISEMFVTVGADVGDPPKLTVGQAIVATEAERRRFTEMMANEVLDAILCAEVAGPPLTQPKFIL